MIHLTRVQANDPAQLKEALASNDVVLIDPPGGDKNVYLTREESSNHRAWLVAKAEAERRGGVVITLDH